jgi:hypothetical protein
MESSCPPPMSCRPLPRRPHSPGRGQIRGSFRPILHSHGAYRGCTGPDGTRVGPRTGACDRVTRRARRWRARGERRHGGSCSQDPGTRCIRRRDTVGRLRAGPRRVRHRLSLDRTAWRKPWRAGTRYSSCHNAIRPTIQFGGSSSTRPDAVAEEMPAITRSDVVARPRAYAGAARGVRRESPRACPPGGVGAPRRRAPS